MTRPLSTNELEKIMAEALAYLHFCHQRAQGIRNAEHTRTKAEEWRSGPRSQLGGDGPVSGGDRSDPTGRATSDQGDRMADAYAKAWRKLRDDLRELRTLSVGIHAHASSDIVDRAPRSPLGAGLCRACGVNCSGAPGDRLRGGLCDADRKRFTRNPERWGHDQVAFERARMREEAEAIAGATYHAD